MNRSHRQIRAAVFSSGMRRIPRLDDFLGVSKVQYRPTDATAAEVDVVLTWGNKATGRKAHEFARRNQKPVWRVEDGFFRSVHPGRGQLPLSLVLDEEGIYYDARGPSDWERILLGTDAGGHALESDPLESRELIERAAHLIETVRSTGVSKYNYGKERFVLPPRRSGVQRILLVDQTFSDASIEGAMADSASFRQMLDWVRTYYAGAQWIVKLHPETVLGKKRGYLSELLALVPEAHVSFDTLAPYALLSEVDHVCTVSSQLGFEALIAGKSVTCFGAAFYSGWGLTDDRVVAERRTKRRSLAQLAAAAWFLYPRYRHPITLQICSAEDVVDLLARQRTYFRKNAGSVAVVGFSRWKTPAVEAFLGGPDTRWKRISAARAARSGTTRVAVWGSKRSHRLMSDCGHAGRPLLTVEDGFLRSSSLGSDFSLPLSLCVDEQGIYYDPSRPSELERVILEGTPSAPELQRAARLREGIIEGRITKYAVQRDEALKLPPAKETILVVGQVESDASIRLGGGRVADNSSLVAAVRKKYPDAYLLYKPHPDVLAGNRRGKLSPEALRIVDRAETHASVVACLDAVNRVATMTSLVGFEALLRNKQVVTYGMPFYAGWGLTEDHETCPRRGRAVSLDHLVYATLIEYPRYYHYETGYFASPEDIIRILGTPSAEGTRALDQPLRQLGRALRYLEHSLRGFWPSKGS